MEPFIVSARKYRPKHFKDVVGQQAITNTLEKAIESNHLAQALLFTGPRGVGKTTCARILAKKINQEGTEQTDEDFAFNIFELDAASNNSVDDIRNLIEQVRIPPQVGKYKVYIIDEVHMLSSSAFNAFLKTLEEPPAHAIFILATTEKHKIIPTILSRCQIFDFKRITVKDAKNHLAEVAKSEGIDAEDDALHIIAQKADGALRDALSIFDRVVSFSGKKLTRKAVTENLNVLDYSYFFQVTDLLLANKIPDVLLLFNEILSKGFDGQHFIMGLASHFRDLMVCKTPATIELLEVGDQVKVMYLEQSQKTDYPFLITSIELANNCDLKYKTSRNHRLLVELCLIQLASITFNPETSGEKKKSKVNSVTVIPPSHFLLIKNDTVNNIISKEKTDSNEEITPQEVSKEEENNEEYNTPIEKKEIIQKVELDISSKLKGRKYALTISSISNKKELLKSHSDTTETVGELPTNSFSEKEMQAVWKQYISKIDNEGKFNLRSNLEMVTPLLKGKIIQIEYPNNTIKLDVERAKHDLLSYIKEELQNFDIDLEINVNETEVKKYVYTPKEKYERLKELNPLIEDLKKDLGLEL
ncbi:MAG: DNA polymerase III subunit gamma/tau [Flavobacteriaceae bacterium]|nr:DNA polymerase III subunit gamma/tau [Flavobacteriaceae bacterium]